jgi:hypothetical protein
MWEVVAVFGKGFKLKCPVGGYPVDTISWTKGTIRLPKRVHQKVTPDGTLLLENVIKTDAGKYHVTFSRQFYLNF